MKKVSIILSFTFIIIFLCGCLTTLHPIFTENDLAYDPKLVGKWQTESNGNKNWAVITNLASSTSIDLPGNISSIKDKGYLVSYQNDDGKVSERYIAFLARIGKHLYFDYYPAEIKNDNNIDDFFKSHFIKMHSSYRVEIVANGSFVLSRLDENFVTKLINEKKIRISHETNADDNMVITASTKELQQYLLKYGDEPEAYRNEKTTFTK